MQNSQEFSTISQESSGLDLARQARLAVRQAFTATLATVDRETGYPYASLVTVATTASGDAILLLSGLARHARNIEADGRSSLLVEVPAAGGDPLAAARVTVLGDVARTDCKTAQRRFLVRHPEASGYADFTDFAFYELRIIEAHFIAGFGRIRNFQRSQFCLDDAHASVALDDPALNALAKDHPDLLKRCWHRCVGTRPGEQIAVLANDADGLDARMGGAVQRLNFPEVISSGDDVVPALRKISGDDEGQDAQR